MLVVAEKCIVCGTLAQVCNPGGSWKIECPRCGVFSISKLAQGLFDDLSGIQRTNLSGWIRENQNWLITPPDLARLKELRTPSVGEKADKIMLWLSHAHPKPGARIPLFLGGITQRVSVGTKRTVSMSAHIEPEMFARAWAQDDEEIFFLVVEYLVKEKHLLEDAVSGDYFISPGGWSYIHSLAQIQSSSRIGFVAMWFDDSLKDAWIAIENGIRDAGYKPFRVDQKEHNNDITDEIIAGIRGSKFLVADLTRHRNGVYFEAGFARGLGLEVVWLCRKIDEKDRHFDIRQLNCIFWEENKLPELTQALKNRIIATIGQGPVVSKSS